MGTFSYKAKDRAGNTVAGIIDADSESHAAAKVREMGHLPMDIRAACAGSSSKTCEAEPAVVRYLVSPIWTGVNIRTLMFFFRQMSTLLAAGMTLSEALRSVGSRTGGRMRRIVAEMHETVMNGRQLSEVMSRYPRIFSPLQLSLVRVGEGGGLLEQMIDRIASYLEYEMSVRRRLAQAMFYPILIFVFILLRPVVMAFILGGTARGVSTLVSVVSATLLPLICLILGLKLVFQSQIPRLVWDTVKMQPPVLGAMARKIAMSRFSRALAVLYSAGIPLAEALSVAADASANVAVARGVKRCVPAVQAGEGLTASLEKSGAVMPMVLDMLSAGEKTGGMDTVLDKVAGYMDDEVDVTIHKVGIVLFVLMIIAAGVVVALQLGAFYTGYFNKLFSGAGA